MWVSNGDGRRPSYHFPGAMWVSEQARGMVEEEGRSDWDRVSPACDRCILTIWHFLHTTGLLHTIHPIRTLPLHQSSYWLVVLIFILLQGWLPTLCNQQGNIQYWYCNMYVCVWMCGMARCV